MSKKTDHILLKVSPEEKAKWIELAEKKGYTLSRLIRDSVGVILSKPQLLEMQSEEYIRDAIERLEEKLVPETGKYSEILDKLTGLSESLEFLMEQRKAETPDESIQLKTQMKLFLMRQFQQGDKSTYKELESLLCEKFSEHKSQIIKEKIAEDLIVELYQDGYAKTDPRSKKILWK